MDALIGNSLVGLSRRTVAAINLTAELAARGAPTPLDDADLGRTTGLAPHEVQDLLQQLTDAGIVLSTGDARLTLAKDPTEVSLHEIATAVGESFQRRCPVCEDEGWEECPLREVARQIQQDVRALFAKKTLDDLTDATPQRRA